MAIGSRPREECVAGRATPPSSSAASVEVATDIDVRDGEAAELGDRRAVAQNLLKPLGQTLVYPKTIRVVAVNEKRAGRIHR
jgi:hypothetical protein